MECRVFVARAHRELIAIEFAQRDHARAALTIDAMRELLHHSGIKRRAVIRQNFGACSRDKVACNKHVFVRDGHTF